MVYLGNPSHVIEYPFSFCFAVVLIFTQFFDWFSLKNDGSGDWQGQAGATFSPFFIPLSVPFCSHSLMLTSFFWLIFRGKWLSRGVLRWGSAANCNINANFFGIFYWKCRKNREFPREKRCFSIEKWPVILQFEVLFWPQKVFRKDGGIRNHKRGHWKESRWD